jgi:hypothetical protein
MNMQSRRPQFHELRSINFLVHEYLLENNYKMASVTFSDEVQDQVTVFGVLE